MKKQTASTKKKRVIDFTGVTVEDLGFLTEKKPVAMIGDAKDGNTKVGNTKIGSAAYSKTKDGHTANSPIAEKPADDAVSFDARGIHNSKQTRRSLHLTIIRDYLNRALGDKDRAEIKLSEMQRELDINPKTLFRHLKTLRNTEFEINRMMYGTELKRLRK
jgi:hypothetical protein